MLSPRDHPRRVELNDEVHARPPEALSVPTRLSYLARLCNAAQSDQAWNMVCDLARRFDMPPPPPGAVHYSADFGAFRLKWERHTEFARYQFIVSGTGDDPFAQPAILAAPADWIAALPGETLVAAHVALLRAVDVPDDFEAISARYFGGNILVGASIGGSAATALTDFHIHADGFSRIVVLDRTMTSRQAGRMVQRLLEIDTYRMMALLALPVARELAPLLTRGEQELAQITGALVSADANDEALLLERLTRLGAEIDSRETANHYRFSAAGAYYELVQRRIADLREHRIEGMQRFQEFTERRLAPAMNTLRAVASRQRSLSERLARAVQLLATRVDVTRERQNQKVLESMNRRAKLQIRLQQTVEGLSVAAVTYYVVGLVGYAAKGAKALGLDVNPDVAIAVSIPLVAALTAYGVHRIRRLVTRGAD
ncbi:MAG: DUF3422 family protein [Xanthobacteraceae bacterium]